MGSIKTISFSDDQLWKQAADLSQRRSEDGKPNMSQFIRDLITEEVRVKERQRIDRQLRTPAARIRLAADELEKQVIVLRQAADLLEQS
jgi:hypothetical protein